MVAQDDGRGADADLPRLPALKFAGNFVQPREERRDERKKFFALRRQRERPPLEQRHAEKFLEPPDLRAHRRLLDAVGNVPHRRHDAAVFGDVIKEFEVMNIH
jgi:hypothetical protein